MKIAPQVAADPSNPLTEPYWITLGGGLEEGETAEEGAARELLEETGLTPEALVAVGHGSAVFNRKGVPTLHDETFFLVTVRGGSLDTSGMEDEEATDFRGHRWFTADELRRLDQRVMPGVLPDMLPRLLELQRTGSRPSQLEEIDLTTPTTTPAQALRNSARRDGPPSPKRVTRHPGPRF